MIERMARMKKVTIAEIEGRARGGGSEFVLALDMRFGALGKATLGQPEIFVDELPGGGGTQRLTRLLGRGRALEMILSGANFSAALAERYGYLNRAFPPEELTLSLKTWPTGLASSRLAQLPDQGLRQRRRTADHRRPRQGIGILPASGERSGGSRKTQRLP